MSGSATCGARGLLHDIGKLGVSNLVLDKPSKPTAEEFDQIRKHPDYSLRILEQVQAFDRLADVAAAHHERLDGRGYHRRLDGSRIPWAARVLTVADVCEAMSARRPYRDGMAWEQIHQTLMNDAGAGVDRDCLEALSRWHEHSQMESRVEAQLREVDRLLAELLGGQSRPRAWPARATRAVKAFRLAKPCRLRTVRRKRRAEAGDNKDSQNWLRRADRNINRYRVVPRCRCTRLGQRHDEGEADAARGQEGCGASGYWMPTGGVHGAGHAGRRGLGCCAAAERPSPEVLWTSPPAMFDERPAFAAGRSTRLPPTSNVLNYNVPAPPEEAAPASRPDVPIFGSSCGDCLYSEARASGGLFGSGAYGVHPSLAGLCPSCDQGPSRAVVAFVSYDSWRGVQDGSWQNNGIASGLNFGTRLGRFSDWTGIGFQIGGSAGRLRLGRHRLSHPQPGPGRTARLCHLRLLSQGQRKLAPFQRRVVQDWMINSNYGVIRPEPDARPMAGPTRLRLEPGQRSSASGAPGGCDGDARDVRASARTPSGGRSTS